MCRRHPRTWRGAVDGILDTGGVTLAYLPYVDGEVLDRRGGRPGGRRVADVPVITGATAHEFTAAGAPSPPCWPPVI